MDIISLITQTNAISILFFCITAILVTYEFVLFLRDKKKKVRPVIPGFSAGKPSPVQASKPAISTPPALKKKGTSSRKNAVAGIAGLVILATTGLIVYITIQNNNKSALPPINSQAQSDTTQELITISTDSAQLDTAASDEAMMQQSDSSETAATGTAAESSDSAALSGTDAEATETADLLATSEADTVAIDDSVLDEATDATLAAATEPSPTPISELPLTSSYQYFFSAVAVASMILLASLVF